MTEPDYLYESIKTIKNLCEVAQVLINIGQQNLLPTILELLYQEAQSVIDEHCVVKDV